MADLGKILVFFGFVLVVIGSLLFLFGKTHLPLGRLPGDIVYRGKNSTVYFPVVSSILVSLVLSVVLYVIGRYR